VNNPTAAKKDLGFFGNMAFFENGRWDRFEKLLAYFIIFIYHG
jgi:hypothetical protein